MQLHNFNTASKRPSRMRYLANNPTALLVSILTKHISQLCRKNE